MDAITLGEQRGVVARWTLTERDQETGALRSRTTRQNKFTDAGLTNLAKQWHGQGTPTTNLVIDTYAGNVTTATLVGATSISLNSRVDKAGDTQIVIGAGLATQETASFSAVTGTVSPFTYTLTAGLVNAHALNEWVVRQVQQSDVMADIKSEMQYDSVAAPNLRMAASGTGYSSGAGSYTMQFFLTGTQALGNWVTLGLSESNTVAAGTLDNHLVFGFTHTSGNDIELDITLTLANV